jgi:hypothetical protein
MLPDPLSAVLFFVLQKSLGTGQIAHCLQGIQDLHATAGPMEQ